MTEAQLRRAKKLIRKLCANCANGNCQLLDDGEVCICPQLISYSLLCRYFRTAVLPADKELFAEIMNNIVGKRCSECGAVFIPSGNRAQYCDSCKKKMERRKTRERSARYRVAGNGLEAEKAKAQQGF